METNNAVTHSSLIDLDNRYVNSYATEKNLKARMEKDGVNQVRHVVCKTPSGRWTAIVVGFQQHLLGTGWPMVS